MPDDPPATPPASINPRFALAVNLKAASDWADAARAEGLKHLDTVRRFAAYDEANARSVELHALVADVILDLVGLSARLQRLDDAAVAAFRGVIGETEAYHLNSRTGEESI